MTSPLRVHIRFTPQNYAYSQGGSLPKLSKEFFIVKFQKFGFSPYPFFFPLTWDYMGVKDLSSESMHTICSPKFMHTPGEGL